MKQRYILAIPFFLCVAVLYLVYRVYHTVQLNMRLETFMAGQIGPMQDNLFSYDQRVKANEYFINRDEDYSFLIGNAILDSHYSSYWISHNGHIQQLTIGDWMGYYDGGETIIWRYWIRPISGPIVCIGLEGFLPRDWTAGGMGSTAGYRSYTVDTSKGNWQLKHTDSSCIEKYDLFDFLLLSVS
jgi:hypothetical protein